MSNCGCTQTNPCGQPTCQETSCACPVYIKSDCVTEVTANFECLPIASNLPLNETLEAMDSAICDKFDEVDSHFQLTNIGTGAESYKGVNLLGQKEIRKINAVGDLITVTQNNNDISVSIDETELETFVENILPNYNAENVGTGAEVFKEEIANTFRFKTFTSTDSSVTITEGADSIDLSVEAVTPTDINITAGTNITVTEPTPNNFVIASTFYIEAIVDQGVNLTGTGTESDPILLSIDPTYIPDGSTMYDTKEIIIPNITYFNNNFDSNILSPTYGLGKNLRAGWAICNGLNGTPDDGARAVVSWDSLTQSFSLIETQIGYADSTLLEHAHGQRTSSANGNDLPQIKYTDTTNPIAGISGDTSSGGNRTQVFTDTAGESGIGKNIPPSVIRVRIMKL